MNGHPADLTVSQRKESPAHRWLGKPPDSRIQRMPTIALRETLSDAGGILESPSIEFGEDSDSRLVEHMLASVAQHQRKKNAKQTSNRMKGQMMNCYSVFAAPIGYEYKKTGSHGKLLTRVEPIATITIIVKRKVVLSTAKVFVQRK